MLARISQRASTQVYTGRNNQTKLGRMMLMTYGICTARHKYGRNLFYRNESMVLTATNPSLGESRIVAKTHHRSKDAVLEDLQIDINLSIRVCILN